jgi:parafibromin
MKTPYKTKLSKGYIELEAIWFFLIHFVKGTPSATYSIEATKQRIAVISPLDRKAMGDYFTGAVETTNFIDKYFAASTPSFLEIDGKEAKDEEDRPSKRLKTEAQTFDVAASEEKDPATWNIQDVMANEIPFSTRDSVLQGKKPLRDVVMKIYEKAQRIMKDAEKEKKRAQIPMLVQKHGARGQKRPHDQMVDAKRSADATIPIIIVPASGGLISLWNVHSFLHNGAYITTQEAKAKPEAKRVDKIEISRAQKFEPSRGCTYQIIDDVKKLQPGDWERVVAVFASGATWQWQDWPWKRPAEIFANVIGFHVHWADEPINENVKQWKVTRIPLSKTRRFEDRALVTDLWQTLTDFIASHPQKKRRLIF